jgi:mRNA-degrading endonuclease toxin of MazEF toxin-antitoxin module
MEDASAVVAAPATTSAARKYPVLLNIEASCYPSRRRPIDETGCDNG